MVGFGLGRFTGTGTVIVADLIDGTFVAEVGGAFTSFLTTGHLTHASLLRRCRSLAGH